MPERVVSVSEERPAGILPDRAQPHAPAVEKAVLAAMLREPGTCIDMVVEQLGRKEAAFYSAANRTIFSAVLTLNDSPNSSPDLVTVAQYLKETGKLEAIGGEMYLAEIVTSIATTVNLESWCKILLKYAMLRKMIDVCSSSLLKCYDSEADASQLVEEIETDIYNIRNAGSSMQIREMRELVAQELIHLMDIFNKNVEVGIPSGYAQLDDYTGGFKPGEMFVLAARPSIGKTAMAMNIIRHIAMHPAHPRSVAFFSLEMTEQQIARRLLCTEAQIPETAFWNGTFQESDMDRLRNAAKKIRETKIYIDPTGGLTIAELRAKARRLKTQYNIELIAIDYLQLMKNDVRSDSRQQDVADISGGIKKLAKDLAIPVLVLAQLNREIDKNASPNARPKLAHLRESGSIEQDADIVAFLHRNRDDAKGLADGASVEAELIVEKNRNGRTGVVKLLFYPSRIEFVAAAPADQQFGPQ